MTDFIKWLADELEAIYYSIINGLLDGITGLIGLVPVPDFLLNMPSYTLPADVSYWVQPLMIEQGLIIVSGAYIARFILRRIPFIG